MTAERPADLLSLDVGQPIWNRFFTIAPLILIGSRNADGSFNVAPKHMATPIGWDNYYGFVCSPRHFTQRNIAAHGQFTVSFPGPGLIVETSMAASPRWGDDTKPGLRSVPTFAAEKVEGVLVAGCSLYLECCLERIVDGFGSNSLIIGSIVAAQATEAVVRGIDRDDNDLVHQSPLLAYVSPGRFASIDRTQGFPFPAGFAL